jgi:quercetin dioxygenase-like cupin family protein
MRTQLRRPFVVTLAAALLGATALVSATPGSGVTPSYKVVSSNVGIATQVVGGPHGGLLLLLGKDQDLVNILNVHQTFAPGGYSGWHTHAGPGLVIVEQGTITIETTVGCFTDYPQGSVLFEGGPGHIHNALNRTSTPVILDAYFFLPAFDPPGGNSRIDEPEQYGDCVTSAVAPHHPYPPSLRRSGLTRPERVEWRIAEQRE